MTTLNVLNYNCRPVSKYGMVSLTIYREELYMECQGGDYAQVRASYEGTQPWDFCYIFSGNGSCSMIKFTVIRATCSLLRLKIKLHLAIFFIQ